eukprot:c35581_g1_i1 orf=159-383(+)
MSTRPLHALTGLSTPRTRLSKEQDCSSAGTDLQRGHIKPLPQKISAPTNGCTRLLPKLLNYTLQFYVADCYYST